MKIHIGCKGEHIEGFKRLDIVQHGDVDFVQDAADLSNFQEASVDEIYASHIFEHFDKKRFMNVLAEWQRVLRPGGILWVSVPDFDRIVDLYLKCGRVMTTWLDYLIHGDQGTPQDFHHQCFTYATLSGYLSKAGFGKVEEIKEMPYGVQDASRIVDTIFKQPISLNLKATK